MRSCYLRSVALALSAAVVGCSSEGPVPTYADRPFCRPDLQLTVGAGTTPTFAWNAECRVWTLRVDQVATGTEMWTVGEDDESFDGPVVYGQIPTGAGEFGPARPLEPGVRYRALLVQRSNGGRVLTETQFTP